MKLNQNIPLSERLTVKYTGDGMVLTEYQGVQLKGKVHMSGAEFLELQQFVLNLQSEFAAEQAVKEQEKKEGTDG